MTLDCRSLAIPSYLEWFSFSSLLAAFMYPWLLVVSSLTKTIPVFQQLQTDISRALIHTSGLCPCLCCLPRSYPGTQVIFSAPPKAFSTRLGIEKHLLAALPSLQVPVLRLWSDASSGSRAFTWPYMSRSVQTYHSVEQGVCDRPGNQFPVQRAVALPSILAYTARAQNIILHMILPSFSVP